MCHCIELCLNLLIFSVNKPYLNKLMVVLACICYLHVPFSFSFCRDLYAWEDARPTAIENFKKHRGEMHNTTANMLAKDLSLS